MSESQEHRKILVVGTDRNDLSRLRHELERAGYETVEATSFDAGKSLLAKLRPAVLIADVCLGAFNGFHLFLRGRTQHSELVGIITSPFSDSVLQAETHRLGGTFLVRPLDVSELLAVISRSLIRAEASVSPRRGPVERRELERRHVTAPRVGPERRVVDRRNSS